MSLFGRDKRRLVDRADAYHQQYLERVPNGYCGLAGTGVSCPTGLGVATDG